MAISAFMRNSVGAELYLLNTLLARHIKHLALRHAKNCLQHKG